MEYLTIQGSCLISVLIPLNFAIGDYAIWFNENGMKKWKNVLDIAFLLTGGSIALSLVAKGVDTYVPVMLFGGIAVAIIQNSVITRKTKEIEDRYEFEKLFHWIGILIGIIIIALPHTKGFFDLTLSECRVEVIFMCYIIYGIWGVEKVIFNIYKLKKYNALTRS